MRDSLSLRRSGCRRRRAIFHAYTHTHALLSLALCRDACSRTGTRVFVREAAAASGMAGSALGFTGAKKELETHLLEGRAAAPVFPDGKRSCLSRQQRMRCARCERANKCRMMRGPRARAERKLLRREDRLLINSHSCCFSTAKHTHPFLSLSC